MPPRAVRHALRVGGNPVVGDKITACHDSLQVEEIRERTGDGRKRAMAASVKFGRKPKLSDYQRAEAIKRRTAGERLADIAKSYAVDISLISRLT